MLISIQVLACRAALHLAEAALDEAEKNGWRVAVAVVDPAGTPLAVARMDEVAPPTLDFAIDKAFTAATMRRSTEAFFERMASSPSLRLGLHNRDRLMLWGGGLPIVLENRVVGGIGVSGAQDFEDIACAKAGLVQAGLGWEL